VPVDTSSVVLTFVLDRGCGTKVKTTDVFTGVHTPGKVLRAHQVNALYRFVRSSQKTYYVSATSPTG
jgi:hypothetical protein